jgi:hypothetical protein
LERGRPQLASDRVMRYLRSQNNESAFLEAALLRTRVQSMVDREVRLVQDADTTFPHVQVGVHRPADALQVKLCTP